MTKQTLPEMIDRLTDAGFIVSWNANHDTAFVSLQNRVPWTWEVIEALDFHPEWIVRGPNSVIIEE